MVFQETCLTCGNKLGGVLMIKGGRVYLYGVPRDMLDLWQQARRCACDGQTGKFYPYGAPRDKLDLWQQAGRCVCYGQRGIVYLYGVPRDILDLWQQARRCAHYGQREIVYISIRSTHQAVKMTI